MSHHDRPRYVPVSTYRLQVHAGVPADRGRATSFPISRGSASAPCYTSPYFTAAPGSTHGYDVCNHNEINPELGGAEAHEAFVAARCARTGCGTSSTSCRITWASARARTPGGTTCSRTGRARPSRDLLRHRLDAGQGGAAREAAAADPRRSVRPCAGARRAAAGISATARSRCATSSTSCRSTRARRRACYATAVEPLTAALGADNPQLHEFLSILTSAREPAAVHRTDPERMAERQREKEVARGRAGAAGRRDAGRRRGDRSGSRGFNGEPGKAESFDALHELLEAQAVSARRTGAPPRTRSTTGASSTSTRWPGCASRTRRSSTRPTSCSATLLARRHGARASASIIPTACSIRRATSRCCRTWRPTPGASSASRCGGRPDRPLYVVAEKILSGRERAAARAGRSTARPATTTSTISTASSSTPRRRAGCAGPTPSSPGTPSRSTTCSTRASG